MRKLTMDDISDLREYERTRDDFRRSIIELKKRRRVPLGDIVTLVFENVDTMRWQVQEMARVERMLRDEQIAHEVATYNELIPGDDELSATLFVELDSQEKLREWLPKLVGIHRAGVGLARIEFIVSSEIGVHPMALAHPERVKALVLTPRDMPPPAGFEPLSPPLSSRGEGR